MYYCNTPITSGLVGYWPFEETSGTTTVDLSGSGNNGILVDGVLVNQSGKIGKALKFDGVDDYVLINDSTLPLGNSSRTISVWFKQSDVSNRGALVYYGEYTDYQQMDMELGYPADNLYWQRYSSDITTS